VSTVGIMFSGVWLHFAWTHLQTAPWNNEGRSLGAAYWNDSFYQLHTNAITFSLKSQAKSSGISHFAFSSLQYIAGG